MATIVGTAYEQNLRRLFDYMVEKGKIDGYATERNPMNEPRSWFATAELPDGTGHPAAYSIGHFGPAEVESAGSWASPEDALVDLLAVVLPYTTESNPPYLRVYCPIEGCMPDGSGPWDVKPPNMAWHLWDTHEDLGFIDPSGQGRKWGDRTR